MKITKRQLKRIIREEKARLTELGIERMQSGDRDPRIDDIDDLSLGEETLTKMVAHLRALNDLVTSEAGQRTVGGKKEGKVVSRYYRPPETENKEVKKPKSKKPNRFCEECGAKLARDDMFCTSCGAKR